MSIPIAENVELKFSDFDEEDDHTKKLDSTPLLRSCLSLGLHGLRGCVRGEIWLNSPSGEIWCVAQVTKTKISEHDAVQPSIPQDLALSVLKDSQPHFGSSTNRTQLSSHQLLVPVTLDPEDPEDQQHYQDYATDFLLVWFLNFNPLAVSQLDKQTEQINKFSAQIPGICKTLLQSHHELLLEKWEPEAQRRHSSSLHISEIGSEYNSAHNSAQNVFRESNEDVFGDLKEIMAVQDTILASILKYFRKWKGAPKEKKKVRLRGFRYIFWSFVGTFFGIAAVMLIDSYLMQPEDSAFVVGSFGASAVLIYGAVESPLAQPRNLIGGHVFSALVGVSMYKLTVVIPLWVAASFAVAIAINVMQITGTVHPPGGATALIACIATQNIHDFGYLYVIAPILSAALVMLVIALVVNNIPHNRKYPIQWY